MKQVQKNTQNFVDLKKLEDTDPIIKEAKELFSAADHLRGKMDAAEYKHPVLGLVFLKYISDSFEERRLELSELKSEGADPEEKSEYVSENILWVPEKARWSKIKETARIVGIGKKIDDAMLAIEKENPSLKNILPKNYAREELPDKTIGSLIEKFSSISIGGKENQERDVLGRIYEYFLGEFASKEGKRGGEFYTPSSVVRLLVEMINPTKGRLYEPCCGSGGMIVQCNQFLNTGNLAFYGQESNPTTWRLCKMNLTLRGIDADIRWNDEGTFLHDEFPDLKAKYILANPPFNDKEWSGNELRDDKRWVHGIPPESNANYAWIQHFISHLTDDGIAGFVLSNGSLSSKSGTDEFNIRKSLIENNCVECIVRLPKKLFLTAKISATLWFVRKKRSDTHPRKDHILFIDARNLGTPVSRSRKVLTQQDIQHIRETYHNWLSTDTSISKNYMDQNGFCYSASQEEVKNHRYALVPGRYTGTEDILDDDEPFEEKIYAVNETLNDLFSKSKKAEKEILQKMKEWLE